METRITTTDLALYNEFEEAAGLNKTYSPWRKRRESGMHLVYCMIVKAPDDFWYHPFIGVEFLGRLHYNYSGKTGENTRIDEVVAIKQHGKVYINDGKSVDIGDVMIL